MCWSEASRRNRERPGHGRSLLPVLETIDSHQLFFADMLQALRIHYHCSRDSEPEVRRTVAPPTSFRPAEGAGQYSLFETCRDLSKFERPPHSQWAADAVREPHITLAMRTADRIAESHGWSQRLTYDVRRGLMMALACRPPDERVRYSELEPLAALKGISVTRVAAVLDDAGLLLDDRPDVAELNWHRRLTDISDGIKDDVLDWLRHLRRGSRRSKPRQPGTANEYCRVAAPILRDWSKRYGNLREVTNDDICVVVDGLPANRRSHTLVVLRSLFRYLKREKRIFANPTIRLRPGRVAPAALLPVDADDYREAVVAATTPQHRLALVLAAVHAARPADIRNLRLDDIDLGARRMTIKGHTRRIDELTHRILIQYLDYRRRTWPYTANRHLLVTSVTANDARPVSDYTVTQLFGGLKATLGKLSVDRRLEEAITHGPDPLHLAAVFGLSHGTAIRYSEAARVLLNDGRA